MPDIIKLLPDSVANQIAAGEVIQRPASVVKELVENAIDAGADDITIVLKDAGKSFIQVIDNGCGMSATDARMAFERHATSKIQKADDLFAILTKGFRGEALASIAAISELTLKTRRREDELGTSITISASEVKKQEPVSCPGGTSFVIRNLFFNVPARRKFLKTETTELRNAIVEFQRIALAHSNVCLSLIHNGNEIYNLPETGLKQRLVHLFGRKISNNLVDLHTNTSIVKISGYLVKPEASKRKSDQYFFANGRYMRHPYFHKAVMQAYEKILPPDVAPSYFIYLDVDPSTVDINIHPTKTEIKFEDERSIFQILMASTKEALGKFNVVPSLDFNNEKAFNIPMLKKGQEIKPPTININPDFNPFEAEEKSTPTYRGGNSQRIPYNWETLYSQNKPAEQEQPKREEQQKMDIGPMHHAPRFIQLKAKYILTPVKSGLMIIDQRRAHERILYERMLQTLKNKTGMSQKNLYPQTLELHPGDYALLEEVLDDIILLGFDIRSFGNNTVVINGIPAGMEGINVDKVVENLLADFKNTEQKAGKTLHEKLARSLSRTSAIGYGKELNREEMQEIVDKLFACESPNYSPTGKNVIHIVPLENIEQRFK